MDVGFDRLCEFLVLGLDVRLHGKVVVTLLRAARLLHIMIALVINKEILVVNGVFIVSRF